MTKIERGIDRYRERESESDVGNWIIIIVFPCSGCVMSVLCIVQLDSILGRFRFSSWGATECECLPYLIF